MNLEALTARLKNRPPPRLAVSAPADGQVLQAVSHSLRLGIARPVLIGDENAIRQAACDYGVDLAGLPVLQAGSQRSAAALAVELVRKGEADLLMKGMMQTADLLRAVLDRDSGLRTGRTLSHVCAVHCPTTGKTLFVTDCVMVPYPDLKAKADLIENAVAMARGMGVELPRVAVIAAVELVNPDMPATVDAALLTMMNRRGQIKNCIVDGPLAMDLAISPEAARHKNIDSPVAGQADILLMPNIETGNAAIKTMVHMAGCLLGGVVMGASAPVVLSSRSDSHESKLYSIACAALAAGA